MMRLGTKMSSSALQRACVCVREFARAYTRLCVTSLTQLTNKPRQLPPCHVIATLSRCETLGADAANSTDNVIT